MNHIGLCVLAQYQATQVALCFNDYADLVITTNREREAQQSYEIYYQSEINVST